jgi:glutaminyl-peptide cyclotransferase
LEIYNDKFYESTGDYGTSWIYQFDLKSNNVIKSYKLEDEYFGEGITIFNDKIYQLTYKAQKGFIYGVNSFVRIDSFTYETKEGWGLTHDNNYILKTDGSEFIHFLDPNSFEVIKKLQVYTDKGPIKGLNELEYHNDVIYANIWTTNFAVKIDAKTGKVLGRIDFSGLLPVMQDPEQQIDVLNGIAIHPETEKMYITGKLWPKLFEVKLIKKD